MDARRGIVGKEIGEKKEGEGNRRWGNGGIKKDERKEERNK